MIRIFTPSSADEANTNAQNLSVKEIVARLDPELVSVTILHEGIVDPRIASRRNTELLYWRAHGNTARTVWHLLKNPPDVYFFPREGPLDAAFLGLRRRLKLKTALLSYVVSGGLLNGSYPPAGMRNIREADILVANNVYLGHLLKEKFGVDARILYDGIDRRYFFPPESPRRGDSSVTVLCAGSFRPYKRMPMVVREAARWPDVQFRIAGNGEEEQACRDLARELACKNVEFLGHLAAAALGDEMRRSDIFFFPSSIEGHPQVLGQAAACGLPAVAMKRYHPDYVVDGTTGFLAENDEDLSEKLSVLIRRAERRNAMGEAAIAHVQAFDWDVIARKWQETFVLAAASRRRKLLQ
jgi:glycosyltransferase involved in cell wall biosynthesis